MTRQEMKDMLRILSAVCGDGCWEWGASLWQGYGVGFSADTDTRLAHRVVYEMLIAPVASEVVLHHVCKNKACVNPKHLMPLSQSAHMKTHAATRTHCQRGHIWTPENTLFRANGTRQCRACRTARRLLNAAAA